jgi:hypothetical protein
VKNRQTFLKLEVPRKKPMKKGRAAFHALGQLLKKQIEQENKKNEKTRN